MGGDKFVRFMSDKYMNLIVRQVKATLKVEGMEPSESAEAINREFLEGKITSKEAVRRIKALYVEV